MKQRETAAKMDVVSNDDSLGEIGKYFAILIFRGFILTPKYRKNWKTTKISLHTVCRSQDVSSKEPSSTCKNVSQPKFWLTFAIQKSINLTDKPINLPSIH